MLALVVTAVLVYGRLTSSKSPNDPVRGAQDSDQSQGIEQDAVPVPAPSTVPPLAPVDVVSTSPVPGATVSGVVDLTIDAPSNLSQLKWFVDDREVASDSEPPWGRSWDSTEVGNGEHDVSVRVRDEMGDWASLSPMTVMVLNDLTTASVSPSGEAAPRDDLPGWRHVFADDFQTDVPLGEFPGAVSETWRAYPSPWTDTSDRGQYTPERVVSVADGVLTKHVHTEDGVHMVAALTPKAFGTPKFGSLYGRYEVRFRIDRLAPGYKVAWLLWPDAGTNITGSASGVGGNGEIDFPEKNLDSQTVGGFVHHQDATTGSDQIGFRAPADSRDWHTYTIEWSPDLVVFELDGDEVGRTSERVPDTPMHWVLQTETWLEDEDPADDVEAEIEIDWVSVWAYNG